MNAPPAQRGWLTPPDDVDAQAVRHELIDKGLVCFAIGVPFALSLSLTRIFEHGWQPIYLVHLALAVVIVLAAARRRRLSYVVKALLLVGVLAVLGVFALVSFGLVAGGVTLLFICAVMTAMAFGTRAGLVACGIGLVVLGMIGAGVCTGRITFPFDIATYATSPTGWVIFLSAFCVFAPMVILALGVTQHHLEASLRSARETHGEHQRLVNSLPDAFLFRRNADGEFVYVSSSVSGVLGITSDEFAASFKEHLTDHPANRECMRRLERYHLGQTEPPFEIELYHRDRSKRWLHVSETPVRNANGDVVAIEGVAHDITDRRRFSEAMGELVAGASSRLGSAFFETMALQLAKLLEADYILIGEMQGGPDESVRTISVAANGRLADNFAYKLAGTPCENVICQTACSYSSGVTERFPSDALLRGMGVDGYVGVPLLDSRGRALGIMAALFRRPIMDVKYKESLLQVFSARVASELERSRADQALAESEQRYSDIFNATHDAVFIHDVATSEVLDVNHRMLELFGYTREQALGLRVEDISTGVEPYTHERAMELIRRAIHEGPQLFEWHAKRHNGELIWCEVALHSTMIAGRQRVLASVRDISERKRAEEERLLLEAKLRHAQKMEAIGQLAGGVAHDFNNILTVILGNSEMLLSALEKHAPGASEATFRSGLEQIRGAGGQAATLIRRLLAFSRGDVIRPERLDVNRAVRGLEELLRRLISEQIDIAVLTDPLPLWVYADPGQVEQIMVNLAVNAADAMPGGGRLSLRVRHVELDEADAARQPQAKPGRYAVLTVSDTGTGMTPETMERMFEPFFTTKPAGKGTGLGLASVYGTVKQLQGHIHVESAPGEGSSFSVHLPLVDKKTAAGRPDFAPRVSRAGETVLVCEDQKQVRRVMCETLRSVGYRVLDAEDGASALAAAAEHGGTIELVITDVVMPGMSGKTLADRLAATRPGLRVLYVSGHTGGHLPAQDVWSSAVHLLQKPFAPTALLRRVREVLDAEAINV